MKTYNLEDVGKDYSQLRELVEDDEYNDGDWVSAEDAKKAIKAAYEEGYIDGGGDVINEEILGVDAAWKQSSAKKELSE